MGGLPNEDIEEVAGVHAHHDMQLSSMIQCAPSCHHLGVQARRRTDTGLKRRRLQTGAERAQSRVHRGSEILAGNMFKTRPVAEQARRGIKELPCVAR